MSNYSGNFAVIPAKLILNTLINSLFFSYTIYLFVYIYSIIVINYPMFTVVIKRFLILRRKNWSVDIDAGGDSL